MVVIRSIMIGSILILNYLVFQINDQTMNTSAALGGGMYIMGCFLVSIIISILIACITGFKDFKKTDIALFILCTPVSLVMLLLLVKNM